MNPQYGLGIDVGGTYTDVVFLNLTSGKVVAYVKTLTTRPDPSEGIWSALTKITKELLHQVRVVSLATTFATNAIVEERGGEAGLVLIGYDDQIPDMPRGTHVLMVDGGHTVLGEEKAPLDFKPLESNLEAFLKGLDAVAVTGFFSVRNPDHELKIAQFIKRKCDLPVVLGHQLSMRLDAIRRATTAWWNARLIPLIWNLIKGTREVLSEMGILAPLMVVKGDGTLMSARTALNRPIDTLLSGPAASIVGAKHLSGSENNFNAFIVDMGGTTTDMAILVDGKVYIDPEGAQVGRWKTHVEAAKVRTIGLGGDSLISVDDAGLFLIGPQHVMPLCVLAERDPRTIDILKMILRNISKASHRSMIPCSFYVKAHPQGSTGKKTLPNYMQSDFVSEFLVLGDPKSWSSVLDLKSYEKGGFVVRSSLTPTDIRVAAGQFQFGSQEAAQLGLSIFARYVGMDESYFSEAVEEEIRRRLCLETIAFVDNADAEDLFWLGRRWFREKSFHKPLVDLDIRVTLTSPVIGAGAPAAAYLPMAFRQLNTECILPDAFSVTGAVGAVVGMVSLTLTGEIRPTDSRRYSLHTPAGKETFNTLEQALSRGQLLLEALAREQMQENHVADPVINFSIEEKKILTHSGEEVYLATVLYVRATGRPAKSGL
jgi:N-methylhydantoinase A/oxoprolinase/acetone carboxylase beta subunit